MMREVQNEMCTFEIDSENAPTAGSSRLYTGTLKTPGLQRSNFRRLKINLKSSGGDLLLEHF